MLYSRSRPRSSRSARAPATRATLTTTRRSRCASQTRKSAQRSSPTSKRRGGRHDTTFRGKKEKKNKMCGRRVRRWKGGKEEKGLLNPPHPLPTDPPFPKRCLLFRHLPDTAEKEGEERGGKKREKEDGCSRKMMSKKKEKAIFIR